LEAGLATALEKFIPEFKVKEQWNKLNESFTVTILFFGAVGLIISFFLVLIVSMEWLSWFKIKDLESGSLLLLLAAGFSPFSWALKALIGGLKGFNKYHELNIVDVFTMVANAVLLISLAALDVPVVYLFLAQQSVEIVKTVILWRLLRKCYAFTLWGHKISDLMQTFRLIFNYSGWLLIMRLSGMFVNQFDKIIVSSLIGVDKLPIYNGIEKLMKIVIALNAQLKKSIIPIASEIYAKSDLSRINTLAYKMTAVLNSISAPIVTLLILFGEPVLIVFGKHVLIPYLTVFQVGLCLFMVVSGRAFLVSMHLGAGKIVRLLSLMDVLRAVSYLVTVYLFIQLFQLNGAILANPVATFILFPLWIYVIFTKANISFRSYMQAFWKGQGSSWIIIGLYFLSKFFLQQAGLYGFWEGILTSACLALLLFFLSWRSLDMDLKKYAFKKIIWAKNKFLSS